MEQLLKDFSYMVAELRRDNSRHYKEDVLRRYPQCKELLHYTYNPYILFHVRGDTVLQYMNAFPLPIGLFPYGSLTILLIQLSERIVTGDSALRACTTLIQTYPEHEEIIKDILNKDLSCGISTKTINKVWPGLIPEFKENVPLAKDYKTGLCDFEKEQWFLSRKLDGVRCLVFIDKGEIEFFSRNGIPFETLEVLRRALQQQEILMSDSKYFSIIIDGELCIVDDEGIESFSKVMQVIRRKDYIIPNPRLYIFDGYTTTEFKNLEQGRLNYEFTYAGLKSVVLESKHISVLEQKPITNEEDFNNIPSGWEGFILRKGTPTQFRRSNHLLKVKTFFDAEYKVTGIKVGKKVIDGAEQDCVGSLIIIHKGEEVFVGSGLTDQQRIQWYSDKGVEIIGKKITVKYFEQSMDKNGKPSLRFPILKRVWSKDTE